MKRLDEALLYAAMLVPLPIPLDLAALGLAQVFNEQSLEFQDKIIERSGLGDETYLPDGKLLGILCS